MLPLYQLRMVYGLTILCLLTACGGQTNIESDLGIKGAPDWVNEGSQAVSNKGGRLIHGVGIAPPLGDLALQKSTAEQRARAEIARILSSYMDVAMQDYMQAGVQGEQGGFEASVQQQINSFSRVVLSGSRILGHWRDKKTDTIYAFAELDVKQVEQVLATTDALNQNLKDYLSVNNAQIFDRFITGE